MLGSGVLRTASRSRLAVHLLRLALSRESSRRYLCTLYDNLTWQHKAVLHRAYAKIYRSGSFEVHPGQWKMDFGGRKITIPLSPGSVWLDWDISLSVLGHNIEIKSTHASIISSAQRPDIFVDVGANYGTHSLLLMLHEVEAIAVEPNPTCHDYAGALWTANGVSGVLEKVAFGSARATVTLRYPPDQTWRGSISKDTSVAGPDLSAVEVAQTTLDSLLPRLLGKRVLIKIDAEGSELDVLAGGMEVLRQVRPPIIFESIDRGTRPLTLRFLSNHDYAVLELPWTPLSQADKLDLPAFTQHPGTNFIAVPVAAVESPR
jgi:FkbM family methyltransferase